MDAYQSVRSLPFPAIASLLGISMERFKRRKDEWSGACPIHGSKNNQSCFNYSDTGKYHCFSCNAKGNGAIDLTMAVLKIGFKDAVEKLGAVQVPTETKKPPTDAVERTDGVLKPLEKDSWRKFAVPCPWLEQRIPDAAIREKYGVYAYNNPARKSAFSGRVMIPIKDVDGRLYGYLGRDTSGSTSTTPEQSPAKYLFPRDFPKSRFLFGGYELRQHLAGLGTGKSVYQQVYLLESPFAVMKFASLGIPAVSPFGWSVSEEQLQILTSLTKGIVYLPDRNKFADGAHVLPILSASLWLRFPPLPEGVEDPEYLSREQIQALTR